MTRVYQARQDASIFTIQNKIEIIFGLPVGSVKLVRPDGKKKRSDASVQSLRHEWS